MAITELTCQIHVKKAGDDDVDTVQPREAAIVPLKGCPDIGIETRTLWVNEVMKHFAQTQKRRDRIRPWDFVARLDGSVESLATLMLESDSVKVYPTRFQIPSDTLHGLDHHEKVTRIEMFVMTSLFYEIVSEKKSFKGLTDDEVQRRFVRGDFPEDVTILSHSLIILSG